MCLQPCGMVCGALRERPEALYNGLYSVPEGVVALANQFQVSVLCLQVAFPPQIERNEECPKREVEGARKQVVVGAKKLADDGTINLEDMLSGGEMVE